MPASKPRLAVYVTDEDVPMIRAFQSNGFRLSTICRHLLWKFAVEHGLIEKPIDKTREDGHAAAEAK